MELGEKIREMRKSKGMLQAILSSEAGISMRTLQRFENGERSPNMKTLERIADALEVSVSDLIEGDVSATLQASQSILNNFVNTPEKWKQSTLGELTEKDRESRLKKAYKSMNEAGQIKAVEDIEVLAKVPDFQKED